MTHPAQLVLWALVLLAVGTLLRMHLWRAWLFLRPGAIRLAEVPEAPLTPALLERAQMLEALGFKKLGAHLESAPLGPRARFLDFVHEAPLTFATLAEPRRGQVRVYFFTPGEQGPWLTADHFRPAGKKPNARSAGMPGWPLHRLFRAHQERASRESAVGPATLDRRLEAGRAWYAGPGAAEVRELHLAGLMWTLGTIGVVAWALLR